MHAVENFTLHEIGAVSVGVRHVLDDSPDFSHLGAWSNFRAPRTCEEKLVHLATGSVLDHFGIWRDARGRITAEPEEYERSRELQYTFHDNGHDRGKYALQDSRRMEGMNNGDWCYLGIVATVEIDGVEVADASVWGVESDSGAHLLELAKECAREALADARSWLDRRCA